MTMTHAVPPTIAENLAAVRERIAGAARRAGRSPEEVTLIAVSKTKPARAVLEAFRAGQEIFGENRVQEALAKMAETGPGPDWHLIGHLQTNKAKQVPGNFAAVHSVDSERVAAALSKHAEAAGHPLDVYLQLNLDREATKAGVTGEEPLRRLAEFTAASTRLVLKGLMAIPAPSLDEGETRRLYARIRDLLAALKAEFGLGESFRELSFGMSHDFEWAIEEGATLVRVGSAIFGARP
jgi:hypothetical protein